MRITVDANVWVSAVLSRSGGAARIIDAFMEGRFTVVTNEPLLAEVEDVLSRPRIARRSRFTPEEAAELVAAMRDLGISFLSPVSGGSAATPTTMR